MTVCVCVCVTVTMCVYTRALKLGSVLKGTGQHQRPAVVACGLYIRHMERACERGCVR